MQGPLAAEVTPYERGRRFLKPGEVLRAGEALTSVDCKSKLVSRGIRLSFFFLDPRFQPAWPPPHPMGRAGGGAGGGGVGPVSDTIPGAAQGDGGRERAPPVSVF